MPVSLPIWRLRVGLNNGSKWSFDFSNPSLTLERNAQFSLLHFFLFLLLLCGDVHPHPGPYNKKNYNFSLCYWNVNSVKAHNFLKLSLLSSYNSIYKYDLICLSETFLDSSFPSMDERLSIDNYDLVRADHPNDVKRGGVCVYVKNSLSARTCNISRLNECIVLEVSFD